MPRNLAISLASALLVLTGCNVQAPTVLLNLPWAAAESPAPAAAPPLPAPAVPTAAEPTAAAPKIDPRYTRRAILAIKDYDGPLPGYVHARVEALYRWAAPRKDCLQWFQCTCGCEGEGHQNNWNCYVKNVKPDGAIDWDSMSVG